MNIIIEYSFNEPVRVNFIKHDSYTGETKFNDGFVYNTENFILSEIKRLVDLYKISYDDIKYEYLIDDYNYIKSFKLKLNNCPMRIEGV
jgi:hypothetical protein